MSDSSLILCATSRKRQNSEEVDRARDPAGLCKHFEAYALNTAGTVADKTLHDAVGIDRKTAPAYERLLGNLLFVEALPACGRTASSA